jgi:hypothetical protein
VGGAAGKPNPLMTHRPICLAARTHDNRSTKGYHRRQ